MLNNKKTKLAVVGMGYVGMPIAVSFSEKVEVIGFDLNREKIERYRGGIDPTKEVGDDVIESCDVDFTYEEKKIKEASFIIIAVPTPVKNDHSPDLSPVIKASEIVGRNLSKGAIVVYESTVYPGVTEEICIPILERESKLECGKDFKVGYSPERINPGDKVHRLEKIIKIVSGMDTESREEIANVYRMIIEAGVYEAESIKVAEAAKVIENSQRDINIAFMNELSIIFNKLGIDTNEVLKAAATKWNFLNFNPGLVGGHCIGVDPYYLTYKAEELGYHSQIILAGRRINDNMGKYVAEQTIKKLITEDISIINAKIGILGFTFKEDCPDTRNTKVMDIIKELKEYGVDPIIADPIADKKEMEQLYGISINDMKDIEGCDAVIIAVGHSVFKGSTFRLMDYFNKNSDKRKVVIDIKGILNKEELDTEEYVYWRL